MRAVPYCLLAVFALGACTTLEPEHIAVYGAAWSVSAADIRAAIAAARAGDHRFLTARIYNVKVHNSAEIFVSAENSGLSEIGGHAKIQRIAGRWRYIETVQIIVTS